jgi:2,4-dienoyl-CoA reductase (NADPH2)
VTAALQRVRMPWSIGGLSVQHRIVMGSMHTGLETRADGGAALAAFYRERVESGAGLIITGGLAISSAARGGPDYAVITDEAVMRRLAFVVEAVHEAGGAIAAQLFHAGRYAVVGGLTDADGRPQRAVAPSPIAWRAARGPAPDELTESGVGATIDDYARAARSAAEIGFDAVEIMASEGYLINQFCSPLTNMRDDAWGGDAERRRRFPLAVLGAVRSALPDGTPAFVRISGDDLMPGSSTQEEVETLARELAAAGADALSVGIGWHESTVPTVQATVPHGAWLAYAERIAASLAASGRRVPVIASNRIIDLREAELILERGTVDAVALARPFLADPAIVDRSFRGDFALVNSCIGCDQACIDRSLVFEPVSCLVNPRAGRETEFPRGTDARSGRFAVVGAGPAGLAAALDLTERGHAVTLFEASDALGGQFGLAARIPGKEDYARTPRSAELRLRRAGADIRKRTSAGIDELRGFDGVVLATGVEPRTVEIPGAELPHVLSYERALNEGVPAGNVAIIGGGGIGIDVAAYLVEPHDRLRRAREFAARYGLAESAALVASDDPLPDPAPSSVASHSGADVTILRRSGRFGAGVGITSRWVAVGTLRNAGVRMISDIDYRRITASGVEIVHSDGSIELVPAHTVVVCAGQEPVRSLADVLAAADIPFELVGGGRDARSVDAVRATREGLEAARRLTACLR